MKPHMQTTVNKSYSEDETAKAGMCKNKFKGTLSYRNPRGKIEFSRSHSARTHKQAGGNCRLSIGCLPACNNYYQRKMRESPKCKNTTMTNTQKTPTKPSTSFLFQTVQGSEGFNKLYEASSSRRPLALFVFQAGEPLCMTIY